MYTSAPLNTVRTPFGRKHPHKWMVKRLSGEMAGTYKTFNTEEQANSECFTLANEGVCPHKIPPLFDK